MFVSETLLERNLERREELSRRTFTITPSLRALVISCADHRVNPAHILGLDLGEAVVLANPGGRVNPRVMEELALLAVIAMIEGIDPGFELIVIHHTDCGLSRLGGAEHAEMLAHYFGIPAEEVPNKHVTDPWASVKADLEALRANPLLPRTLVASGIVYDITSGRAEIVCPPAPLGTKPFNPGFTKQVA
jgi:carbonic anhydrase